MTCFLFSALCALILNTGILTAPADTLHHYVIDSKPVENFDGSQLTGVKIESYNILTLVQEDGKVVRIHDITTDRNAAASEGNTKPLIIIDGKVCTEEEMQQLDPQSVASMHVFKGNAAQSYEKYGNTANGVIYIELKEPGSFKPSGKTLENHIIIRGHKTDKK